MTTVPPGNPLEAGPPPTTPVPDPAPGVSATTRTAGAKQSGGLGAFLEWVVVIVAAVAVALLIKTFVMQAFYIPSESMLPTLEKNDRVLVNKLSYRLHDINRGDIVVFEKPPQAGAKDDATSDLIKRVIGLPGEQIAFDGGKVHINGQVLDEPYLPAGVTTSQGPKPCTLAEPCTVPTGSIWVMGDNRSNSSDSRYIGPVPQDNVVGRAFVRIWPFSRLGGL